MDRFFFFLVLAQDYRLVPISSDQVQKLVVRNCWRFWRRDPGMGKDKPDYIRHLRGADFGTDFGQCDQYDAGVERSFGCSKIRCTKLEQRTE